MWTVVDTVKLSLNICFNLFLLVSYTDEERGEREENEGEGGEIEEEEEGKKKKKKKQILLKVGLLALILPSTYSSSRLEGELSGYTHDYWIFLKAC